MGRTAKVLIAGSLLLLTYFFLSSSFSPLSFFNPPGPLPDRIDDVYADFDTLRTDLSDYAWPTDASRKMSSAFASFRTLHFHAGIDISTNGRTGYKVFASRDGYVSRISISPYGYGRLLWVQHEDGFTTVYAHLQRFADSLEARAREEQYRLGHYAMDLRFSEPRYPVSKGDVIARTGDTGVGPAHLHFEIRDEALNPVNPLLCTAFADAITDTHFPEFQQLSFTPIDYASRVNGLAEPQVYQVRSRGNHRYSLSSIVHITGTVGLSVKGSDRADATWQRSNVYQYELYLDSTKIFSSTMDRFSSQETEQIAIHYDWSLLQSGEGRFQKLFLEPGNNLPLYARLPERAGTLTTGSETAGEHQIRIVARDIAGNVSELTAPVMFDHPPTIDVQQINQQLVLIPPADRELRIISVESKSQGKGRWNGKQYDASTLASAEAGLLLPVDQRNSRILRIQAKDGNGSWSNPVYFSPAVSKASKTSLALKKEFLRDYLVVTVSSHLPFTLRPSLWIIDAKGKSIVELQAKDERSYFGTLALGTLAGGMARLEANGMVNGTAVDAYDEFSVFPITPEEGGRIIAGNGALTLEFPPQGVYQPLYCRIEREGDEFSVLPRDVLLNLGATVSMPAPVPSEKAGLYFSGDEGYELLSARQEQGVIRGTVRNVLGSFVVREDSVKPEISGFRVWVGGGRMRVTARLHDGGSGISANSIKLYLDEQLIIPAYDPYHHTIRFDETLTVLPGPHDLRLETSDRIGNIATARKTFRISR